MKAELSALDLQKAVSFVLPSINKRSPMAVLTCILLEFGANGRCRVRGGGAEGSSSSEIPCESKSDFSVLVDAEKLRRIAAECADRVEVTDGKTIAIKSGGSKWKLGAQNPQDYPPVDQVDGLMATVPSVPFRHALRLCATSTDSQSSRYVLSGVGMDWQDGDLTVFSTDGRQACVCAVSGCVPIVMDGVSIMSGEAIGAVEKLLDAEETVAVTFGANALAFENAGGRVVSRLLEGRMPKIRDILSKGAVDCFRVNIDRLGESIRKTLIVVESHGDSAAMDIHVDGESLRASAPDSEYLGGDSAIQIESKAGYQLSLRLDAVRFRDWLRAAGGVGELLSAGQESPTSALFGFLDGDRVNCKYVLMPMVREGV